MKFPKIKSQNMQGFLPFSGTPHVNAQRHLRGPGRFFSKKEMEQSARYLMSINHVYTGSRFMAPSERDQIEITRRSSRNTRW